MNPQESITQALREVWFWTGILRDHMTFLVDSFHYEEREGIRWSRDFRELFSRLHDEAAAMAQGHGIAGPAGSYAVLGAPVESPMARLQGHELREVEQVAVRLVRATAEAIPHVLGFKQELLDRKLECRIRLRHIPMLIVHKIIETEEAQRVLATVWEDDQRSPAEAALQHHLLWLPDASVHAVWLLGDLDGSEDALWRTISGFKRIFDGMQIQARELYSMLRVAPRMVAALRRLNRDAAEQIAIMRAFLVELRELLEGCAVLGNLAPLAADHQLREELYYTEKLAEVAARSPG